MSEVLPKGWALAPLGRLGRYFNGRAFKPEEWESNGRPIIRIQNLNDPDAAFNCSTQEFDPRFLVRSGDLLIAWSASLGAFIWNGGEAWLNQHIFRVEPEESICTKHFLFYAVQQAIADLYEKSHGSGMVHVTKPVFEAHQVPLPPLPEQRRIVAKLEALLAKVDASRKRLERIPVIIKRFRQAVLAAACDGRLTEDWRDQNSPMVLEGYPAESPMEIPGSWLWVDLGSLIQSGPQNGLYKSQSAYGDGVPIVRIDAFYDGEIQDWGALKRLGVTSNELATFGLNKDDLLINRVNSPKFLGKCALVRDIQEPTVFESNMMRLHLDNNRILPEFATFYLQSLRGLDELRKNAKHAVNQSSINQQDVQAAGVPLPSVPEQEEIVNRDKDLFSFADGIEAHYTKAKTQVDRLTQSILAKAFRGELVPQDPNDEPAVVLLSRLASAPAEASAPARRRGRPPRVQPTAPAVAPSAPTEDREALALANLTPGAILQAHREVLASIPSHLSEDNLLRAVALRLGFQRLGARIKARIIGALASASSV